MNAIPLFCRWWFAPILIVATSTSAALWAAMLISLEPEPDPDQGVYIKMHGVIGSVIGLAAWYFSRLVARGRVSIAALASLMFPAYGFIMWLALDKNPWTATLTTIAFGFMLAMMVLARRATGKQLAAGDFAQ